jgi:hypothetical protein
MTNSTVEGGVVPSTNEPLTLDEQKKVVARLAEYCESGQNYGRDVLRLPQILNDLIHGRVDGKVEAKRLAISENMLSGLRWTAIVVKNTEIDDAELAKEVLDFVNKCRKNGEIGSVQSRFATLKRVNNGLTDVDTWKWVKGNEATRIKLKGSDLEVAREIKKAVQTASGNAPAVRAKKMVTPASELAKAITAIETAEKQLLPRGTGGHITLEEKELVKELRDKVDALFVTINQLEPEFSLD